MRILTIALFLLIGCRKDHDECEPPYTHISAQGFKVVIPNLVPPATATQVLADMDARAIAYIQRGGYEGRANWDRLRSIAYSVVDHFRFPSSFSSTGFASGSYTAAVRKGECDKIVVAIYSRGNGLTIPPEAPPHTITGPHADGTYSWGYVAVDGYCPALDHEWDHSLGMHHD